MPSQIVQFDNVHKTYQMGWSQWKPCAACRWKFKRRIRLHHGAVGLWKINDAEPAWLPGPSTSGHYLLGAEDVSQMDDDALSTVRGTRLGFIFNPTISFNN